MCKHMANIAACIQAQSQVQVGYAVESVYTCVCVEKEGSSGDYCMQLMGPLPRATTTVVVQRLTD